MIATLPLVASLALGAAGAPAQGFLQSLFEPAAPRSRSSAPPSPFGHRAPAFDPYSRHRHPDRDGTGPEDAGVYRTVCVRLCDGYYWPISSHTHPGRFSADARVCRAGCGEEARLFYQASDAEDARELVDQQGRPYTGLANAFRYRSLLVEGCRCRPEPWALSELARHKSYADSDAEMRRRRQPTGVMPRPNRVEGR